MKRSPWPFPGLNSFFAVAVDVYLEPAPGTARQQSCLLDRKTEPNLSDTGQILTEGFASVQCRADALLIPDAFRMVAAGQLLT